MQLTNALVGAILATGAVAAPSHSHGYRGSTLQSRARQFGGGKQAFGGGDPSWGQGSSQSLPGPSASGAPKASATSGAAQPSGTSVRTNSKTSSSAGSTVSAGAFSSLTVMNNDQWAGAGYSGLYKSGETLKGVSSTFNVMDVSVPTDADKGQSMYYGSAWIGIDGQGTCTEIADAGLWQAGVDSTIESSGTVGFYAWYEWYPAATVVVDIGTISAGDEIFMNLTAASGTEGTIVIENKTTGKTYSKTVTSDKAMCLDTVEWIMEDVTFDNSDEGLASFTPLTFADAVWVTDAGTYPASDSNEHYEITDRTSTTVSGEKVVITYK